MGLVLTHSLNPLNPQPSHVCVHLWIKYFHFFCFLLSTILKQIHSYLLDGRDPVVDASDDWNVPEDSFLPKRVVALLTEVLLGLLDALQHQVGHRCKLIHLKNKNKMSISRCLVVNGEYLQPRGSGFESRRRILLQKEIKVAKRGTPK